MQYLTVKEFHKRLDGAINLDVLYRYLKAGTIPSVRLNHKILIPEDALDRLIPGEQEVSEAKQ